MTVTPDATGPADPHDKASHRLASLDLLRGLTVLGMIVVNGTAGVRRLDGPVFPLLLHAQWAGFTIADSVFPAFILMIGVSISISSRGRPADARRVLWRGARLLLLGLVLTNMFYLYDFERGPLRLAGVLQRIAIVYVVVALLQGRFSWRGRAALASGLLLLYWPLCLIPQPDGLPIDLWAPGHNFVSWADRAVFGGWCFVQGPAGFDPEGLLSTLPTIAEALIGTLVGDWLKQGLDRDHAAKRMGAMGLTVLAVGMTWGLVFPIAKNLWSSSFVLVSAGPALIVLAALHRFADGRDMPTRRGGLLGSLGRNAIAAYALHEVASVILTADALQWLFRQATPVAGTQIAALVPVAIFTALVWWPIAAMDRRGWYLKI